MRVDANEAAREGQRDHTPKALGQFFTPDCVVAFACAAVSWLSVRNVGGSPPRVIDPACGDGAFVLGAWRHGLASGEHIVGIDKDGRLDECWRQAGLNAPGAPRMYVSDGLLPLADVVATAMPESFDYVLGNPPFHGHGIRHEAKANLQTLSQKYAIWRAGARQGSADIDRLRLYPVELLFLERFLQLAKPGGHVAIILPEGVLANARTAPERRWLLGQHTVHAIVGLPRSVFRARGITARTCICFIQKTPPSADHEVFLAEIEETDPALTESLERVLQLWQTRQSTAEGRPWLPKPW